jgi:prepilin-type N-terminal cleavage/methylation domain-containing protein
MNTGYADLMRKREQERGFSLVELLVVVIIVVLIATFAMMSGATANKLLEMQNGSRELKVAFERARFDSVKRRADGSELANVELRSDRFILTTYVGGTPNVQTTMLPQGVSIEHYLSATLPMTIYFNWRGETSGGVPQFRVLESQTSQSEIVLVTATGTVNLLPGASSIPSFSNPSLSGGTSNTASINNSAVIP